MRAVVAAICLVAVGSGACSSTDGADGTAFAGDGFRVRVPAGWQAEAADPEAWPGGQTLAFFSTQALAPQCEGPGERNCRTPVAALDPGSLLVWWVSAHCAGAACQLPEGERLLIGGREARSIGHSGLCDQLDATSEAAYVVAVGPQRLDAIVACDHDASASVRQQLQSLIDSVDWRTP